MLVFISHSSADAHHADHLEAAMRPGGFRAWRFQSDMVGAKPWDPQLPSNIESCDIFLLATTEHALDSKTCEREWQHAAIIQKPMVPVVLKSGVYPPSPINDHQCVFFDESAQAGAGLINALQNAQPIEWDRIPDHWTTWDGNSKAGMISRNVTDNDNIPIPTIHRELTDLERESFLYDAIKNIRGYFDRALVLFQESDNRIEGRIRETSDTDFTCQIYLNGSMTKSCRIWVSTDIMLNGIAYGERSGRDTLGRISGINELASVSVANGKPALKFTFNMHVQSKPDDPRICTVVEASKRLWTYFTGEFNQEKTFRSHW